MITAEKRLGAYLNLWVERSARALVDFVAAQVAAIIALFATDVFQWTPVSEAGMLRFYLRVFLPWSLTFPFIYAAFGVYTRLRGYTLTHKLRTSALSALTATSLLGFVVLLSPGARLPLYSLLSLSFAVITAAVGVRWMKDWLFHREIEADERSQIAPVDRPVTVLVVGGAGYIGSGVTATLLSRGYRVRLLDNLLYGSKPIEPLLSEPNLEFIHGDSRNIQDVVRAMTGVQHIIHLAAIVGDPACAENDSSALQINYAATRMILEVAKGHGIERLVFASSCSVYGASEDLMDEKSQTLPISLYAETKLHSERVLLEAASRHFHPTVLRFATVFGLATRPRFDLVVNLLTAKAIQDGLITIYNGDQWRPFIHVNDLARGVVEVLGAPLEAVSGEILNVGDDRLNFTLAQIAEKIRAQIPKTRVEYVENSDRRNYRVSFRKIRDCIGFAAKHSIEDGVIEIKEAFERGEISNYRHPAYSNVSYLKSLGQPRAKTELDVEVMAAFAGTGWKTIKSFGREGRPILALVPPSERTPAGFVDSKQTSVS